METLRRNKVFILILLVSVFISYASSVSINRANEYKVSVDLHASFNPEITTDFILTNSIEKQTEYSVFSRKIQISKINFDVLKIGNYIKTLFDTNDQRTYSSTGLLLSLICILRI